VLCGNIKNIMSDIEETEEELSAFIHDLFLNKEYMDWRKDLKSSREGIWHSLVVSLDKHNAPLQEILRFGKNIESNLVFNYVKAPDYKQSQMLMVQFTVSGGMWHSLIWHCPERN
jgi:hypothetical protein